MRPGVRGYAVVALRRPKNISNVGSVLRAAGCYGVSMVVLESQRVRSAADTQKAWRHIPTMLVDDVFDARPLQAEAVAVDLVDGARSLVDFIHPERAFYIFGPEDGTLDEETLSRCQKRVMVPTNFCMNLAAAVNVVLYDRLAKQKLRMPNRSSK